MGSSVVKFFEIAIGAGGHHVERELAENGAAMTAAGSGAGLDDVHDAGAILWCYPVIDGKSCRC